MKPTKDSSQKSARHRKVSGLLVRPKQQLRFSLYVFGSGIMILAAFVAIFLFTLSETIAGFAEIYKLEPEIVESLRMSLTSATIFIIAFASILVVGMVFSGVVFAHRFFGPVVPILRMINELKNGNYTARGVLREKDELHEVMAGLNELAAVLDARAEQPLKTAQ